MAEISKREWSKVWKVVKDLTADNEDIVIIGGVAVYIHTEIYNSKDIPVEFTHDADMAISLPTLSQLADEGYEIVTNKRLNKRQIIINDVDVDIYVAHQSKLRVSYNHLAESAKDLADGGEVVMVASLGHLLILKIAALEARWSSAHGEKDRRDVAKLMVMINGE